MTADTANLRLIRTVGYADSEVVTRDHGTATLLQLRKARQDIANPKLDRAKREQAEQLLRVSPYEDDRDIAERYFSVWQCERKAKRRANAFAAINDGTMKRDTLADLAATAGRWFLWGLAAATAAVMLSMAYDLAIDLPGVIARAAQ